MMTKSLLFVFIIGAIVACNPYNRIQKSDDLELKYDAAIRFYEKGDYFKAYPLIEELVTFYRGTNKIEKLYYYFAYCDYNIGDYYLAGYRFKNFAKMFPNSHLKEECLFMSAYCYYLNSPKYSLDQQDTKKAIAELQVFINKFPESNRIDSCNTIMNKLRDKLEKKSYEISKQYFHTRNYKAAISSFENTLTEFPDSEYREEMMFLQVKANYLLAVNSIESKKEERFNNTIKAYTKFANYYTGSKYLKELKSVQESAILEKESLKNKN